MSAIHELQYTHKVLFDNFGKCTVNTNLNAFTVAPTAKDAEILPAILPLIHCIDTVQNFAAHLVGTSIVQLIVNVPFLEASI